MMLTLLCVHFFPSIYLHDKSIIRRKSNETTYIYRILEKKKQSKKNIKSECVYSSSVNMEYGTVCVHCGHQLPEWQTRGMEKNAIYQMKIARCPGDRCFFFHPQLHTHLLTANELKTNQRMQLWAGQRSSETHTSTIIISINEPEIHRMFVFFV